MAPVYGQISRPAVDDAGKAADKIGVPFLVDCRFVITHRGFAQEINSKANAFVVKLA